jgi:hypothetical protein
MSENDVPESGDAPSPGIGPTTIPETPPPPSEVAIPPGDDLVKRGPTVIPETPPPNEGETR